MKRLATSLLLCIAISAQAQNRPQPRHIDFTQVLTGLDGKPIQNADAKPIAPLTLGEAAVTALESQTQADRASTGAEKYKLDELARKVFHATSVVLTVEEIATIKERIGQVYTPIVVGASWRLLDPQPEK